MFNTEDEDCLPPQRRGRQHRELRRDHVRRPIGIVYVGNPEAAYAEAIDVAGAHQSSYGREAAGVVAAVTGVLAGARALPPEWIHPLDVRLATSVPGFAEARFTALAIRTMEVAR